jgi:hypothetical protein
MQVEMPEVFDAVVENVPRDEAVKMVVDRVVREEAAQEENQAALASQGFKEGEIVYYTPPQSTAAVCWRE